jgi:catechol 2,3-dioxygenase-like lactoylglutathione lyase family enzyme
MITGLDHVVVLVGDIEAGVAAYQTLFACAPAWRSHGEGVERVLYTLDNMTLELMSPHGDSPTADRIRAVLDEQGDGLASICFRTGDIAKMHRRLDRLTLKPEPIADAESRDATTGATLSWRRTRAATEMTRGVRLFFVELANERPRSAATADARSSRWIMWWSRPPIPIGPRHFTARGLGSTWRWTVRIRIGAG